MFAANTDMLPPSCFAYQLEYYDAAVGQNVRVRATVNELTRLSSYMSRNVLQAYFTTVSTRDADGYLIFKVRSYPSLFLEFSVACRTTSWTRLNVKELEWSTIFRGSPPTLKQARRKGDGRAAPKRRKAGADEQPDAAQNGEQTDFERYKVVERCGKRRDELAKRRLQLWEELELREDSELPGLKTLPQFPALELPIEPPEFAKLLTFYGFLKSFGECLPDMDENFSLFHLFRAVLSADGKEFFTLLVCELLRTRNARIQVEDYDEADLQNEREIPDYHRDELEGEFGEEIARRNERMEEIRKQHGQSLAQLPITKNNVSEMLLLALQTAGFCPQAVAQNERRKFRGDLLCSEDDLFQFSLQHPKIVEKLQENTIHELRPSEKIHLLDALATNLLTYGPFREAAERNELVELHATTGRILKLFYLEQQYASDYADTLELMEKQFPAFVFKQNGHSKRVKMAIEEYAENPMVDDAIEILLLKTRFDYVQPPNREILRTVQKNTIKMRVQGLMDDLLQIHDKLVCVPLGLDRAFRSYVYLADQRVLLVEGPIDSLPLRLLEAGRGRPEVPVLYGRRAHVSPPLHLAVLQQVVDRLLPRVLRCGKRADGFFLITSLVQLLAALDPRGRREAALLANLKACAHEIRSGFWTIHEFFNSLAESLQITNENERIVERERKSKLIQSTRSPSSRTKKPKVLGDEFVSP
ncbi:hypothetical protein M3Y99_00210900 [Aphelenchoides fujianensis]|nr:hypothetical protein M3Y99_00210900 [Aphelenchoides fujianensis]